MIFIFKAELNYGGNDRAFQLVLGAGAAVYTELLLNIKAFDGENGEKLWNIG